MNTQSLRPSLTHRVLRVSLLVTNALLFAGLIGFIIYGNIVRRRGPIVDSKCYKLEIFPNGLLLYICYTVNYVVQCAVIIYSLVNIWRSTPSGYLYYSPDIIPVLFLIPYMICWPLDFAIYFMNRFPAQFGSALFPLMATLTWLTSVSALVALIFSCWKLSCEKDLLRNFKLTPDIYAVIVVVHNGLSMYASLYVISGALNFGVSLACVGKVEDRLASAISLVIIAVVASVYVSLDFFLLDAYTRYIFVPHCIMVVISASMVHRMGVSTALNSVFAMILMVLSIVLLLAKITSAVLRSLTIRFSRHEDDLLSNQVSPWQTTHSTSERMRQTT